MNNILTEKLKHIESLFNIGVTFLEIATQSKKISKREFPPPPKQIN
jgi:hypothetical protein